MFKAIADFVEDVTDNLIALSVFGAVIYFVFAGIAIPEFFAVIIGMVAMHYFQKDK